MTTSNEFQPIAPNPTGELTLGQRAAAHREAAQPGYAERLASHQAAWDAAPSALRPEWSTRPARYRLELAHIEEQMAQTDALLAELLAE